MLTKRRRRKDEHNEKFKRHRKYKKLPNRGYDSTEKYISGVQAQTGWRRMNQQGGRRCNGTHPDRTAI